MVESLVQWTFLNSPNQLGQMLDFSVAKIIGQEITTDFGRIDFVLSNSENKHLVVELETVLDSKSKMDYCFSQTLNYKNVKFSEITDYCILYAEETNLKNKKIIEKFGRDNNIFIYTYSLETAKSMYAEVVERLSLNVGLALPNPKNYTICFLRWLNKIMKPFLDLDKTVLTNKEIFKPFENRSNS